MDQDSTGSEEEELTSQLYNTLRKHLGRSVCMHMQTFVNVLPHFRVIVKMRFQHLKKLVNVGSELMVIL